MTAILAINSALPYTEIALLKGDETLFYEGWPAAYNEAEKLLPALKKALLPAQKVDYVLCAAGPGGFTGLRVGITIANTVAYQKGARMIGIDTFELLKTKLELMSGAAPNDNTAIIMRAGGKNLAVSLLKTREQEVAPSIQLQTGGNNQPGTFLSTQPHFLETDQLQQYLEDNGITDATGDIPPETRTSFLPNNFNWIELANLPPLDQITKKITKEMNLNEKTKLPSILKPIYFSPPQITPSKKPKFT